MINPKHDIWISLTLSLSPGGRGEGEGDERRTSWRIK